MNTYLQYADKFRPDNVYRVITKVPVYGTREHVGAFVCFHGITLKGLNCVLRMGKAMMTFALCAIESVEEVHFSEPLFRTCVNWPEEHSEVSSPPAVQAV